jgi:hypothetical protein
MVTDLAHVGTGYNTSQLPTVTLSFYSKPDHTCGPAASPQWNSSAATTTCTCKQEAQQCLELVSNIHTHVHTSHTRATATSTYSLPVCVGNTVVDGHKHVGQFNTLQQYPSRVRRIHTAHTLGNTFQVIVASKQDSWHSRHMAVEGCNRRSEW